MAISKSYRLKLAKLLKLYTEVAVDEGVLISESDDNILKVGDEVFVDGEDGLVPAPDKEYVDNVNNVIYVVAGGTVTEIKEKENTLEGNLEDNQEKGSDNGEDNNKGSQDGTGDDNGSKDGTGDTNKMEDNTEGNQAEDNTEDKVKELESALEAANAKVAELEATVSDLEDQIAAYKAKEEETAPSAEDAEKLASQKPKTDLDKKLETAKFLSAVTK